MVEKIVKKYATPLLAVIGVELWGVGLLLTGVLPREATLFLAGILIFFVIFAPMKQAVLFAVFSIPLYTALPILDSFDTMASWRIIVAILFFRTLFNLPGTAPTIAGTIAGIVKSRLGFLTFLFLSLGAVSLLVASEPIFGIRKLIFFVNIFILFFIVKAVTRSKKDFSRILKYTFAGSIVALLVGYAQFFAILFVPLYTFWQWWAHNVTPVFYGERLGNLLSYANTWFSYYEHAEPTLRIFSIFPDSHSVALVMVLTLPIALTFFVIRKSVFEKTFLSAAVLFILLAIIFSGTRGVWVGAVPVFLLLIIFYVVQKGFGGKYFGLLGLAVGSLENLSNRGGSPKYFPPNPARIIKNSPKYFFPNPKVVLRASIVAFIIFILLFPVSSQLLKFSQMRQGGIVSEGSFERLSTSFSTRDISNLGRIQIWKATLESIARHPFLGVGIGNYPVVLNENVSATREGASAHSLYLDVASEMGLLGVVLLLLIFFEILWRAIQVFLRNRDLLFSTFAGFFAVYFLWVMAYSVVDVVLLNDKVLLLFVVLVALLYAVPREKYIKN